MIFFLYRNKGDYDRAIADFTRAIMLKLDDAGFYYYAKGCAFLILLLSFCVSTN
ncbi:hypothetical protein AGMMS49991_05570 [Spirochaetia bacterium]|nr:hypothetical protein AGMMS49991_05570 [Spirochaetia bacterium]